MDPEANTATHNPGDSQGHTSLPTDRAGRSEGRELEAKIGVVGRALLSAVRMVLDELPNSGPGPLALARLLGVDKVLASRVLKATKAADPIGATQRMPGPEPLRRLIRAAGRRGASAAAIERANRAVDDFEALIRDEFGDRSLLDSILSAYVPEARYEFELRRKQAAFKAISQLKGAQADAIVATVLLQPSANPDFIDVIWINALFGVHRVRPDVLVKLATRRLSAGAVARRPTTVDGAPIDDPADPHAALLADFCSRPLPQLTVRRVGDSVFYTLGDTGFGIASAVDLVFAEVNRGELPRYLPVGSRRKSYYFAEASTPAKLLQFDVLVHRDLYPGQAPALSTYDTVFEGVANPNQPARDIDLLNFADDVAALGTGLARVRSAEIRGYADLVRNVGHRAGIDAEALRGFRARVDYPFYGSQVTMCFDAVER